jgi:hypothetical protein
MAGWPWETEPLERTGKGVCTLPAPAYQTASCCPAGRFWDYDAVWDNYPDLSRAALLVRTCIARHADGTGQWIASYGQLAAGAHMSRRQAIRAAQELAGAGLLALEPRRDRQGRCLANALRLLRPQGVAGAAERVGEGPGEGDIKAPGGDRAAPIPDPPVLWDLRKQQQSVSQDPAAPSVVAPEDTPAATAPTEAIEQPGSTAPAAASVEVFRDAFARATGQGLPALLAHHLARRFGLEYLGEKLELTRAALEAGRVRGDPRAYWNAAVHQDWQRPAEPAGVRAERAAATLREQAAAREAEDAARRAALAAAVDRLDAGLGSAERAAAWAEAEGRLPEAVRGWPAASRDRLLRGLYRSVLAEWAEAATDRSDGQV